MQTFLPYSSFTESARCLDYKRLGKQRVEAFQIIQTITGQNNGWQNHPVVKMWRGYAKALKRYYNIIRGEWIRRGYKNNMPFLIIQNDIRMPLWIGIKELHVSHRANLLRKDFKFYSRYGWDEDPTLPYYWPVN